MSMHMQLSVRIASRSSFTIRNHDVSSRVRHAVVDLVVVAVDVVGCNDNDGVGYYDTDAPDMPMSATDCKTHQMSTSTIKCGLKESIWQCFCCVLHLRTRESVCWEQSYAGNVAYRTSQSS